MAPEKLLETIYPTYTVRVYYDTGKTTVHKEGEKKVESKVLLPMVPFGLYLNHEGTFFGFLSDLVAKDGAQLEKTDKEDWFKLKIPNEGQATLVTKVSAEEKPIDVGAPSGGTDGPGSGPSSRPKWSLGA